MRSDFDFRLSGIRVLGCVVIQKLKALALRRDLGMSNMRDRRWANVWFAAIN